MMRKISTRRKYCKILMAAFCIILVLTSFGCAGKKDTTEHEVTDKEENVQDIVSDTETEKTETQEGQKTDTEDSTVVSQITSQTIDPGTGPEKSDEFTDEFTLMLIGHYWYNGTGSMNIMVFERDGSLIQYNVKKVAWDKDHNVDAAELLPENINLTGSWQLENETLTIAVKDANGDKGPFSYDFHKAGDPSTGVGENMASEHKNDNYFYEIETISYTDGMWASQPYDLIMFGSR